MPAGGCDDDGVDALARALGVAAGDAVALSGAGVSVDSDIPAFRGEGGLWDRYDPMEYATLDAFRDRPGQVWSMLRELDAVLDAAEPNDAHRALADLEDRGLLRAVITQNVDGLHQGAGSSEVVEVHGSRLTLTCLGCERRLRREDVRHAVEAGEVPRCDQCGGLMKPDVVFFGEMLPPRALRRAEELVRNCELLLVVGTSAEVYPVADLPRMAAGSGAQVWEVNPEPSVRAARSIRLPAEQALPRVVACVDALG